MSTSFGQDRLAESDEASKSAPDSFNKQSPPAPSLNLAAFSPDSKSSNSPDSAIGDEALPNLPHDSFEDDSENKDSGDEENEDSQISEGESEVVVSGSIQFSLSQKAALVEQEVGDSREEKDEQVHGITPIPANAGASLEHNDHKCVSCDAQPFHPEGTLTGTFSDFNSVAVGGHQMPSELGSAHDKDSEVAHDVGTFSDKNQVTPGSEVSFDARASQENHTSADLSTTVQDLHNNVITPSEADQGLSETLPEVIEVSLPRTVSKLSTSEGSLVYVVGTAHFSKESQDDVAKTIRLVKPDIVVVELCKSRTAILQLDEETILSEAKSMNFAKMRQIIQQHGKIEGILYILLLSLSAHITKQLGMAPGGEFRTAFAEARKSVPGCTIHLGDRPVHITLSRALASLSVWQKIKLAYHILTSKEPISKEEVEKCKDKDFIEELLAEMTGQFPAVSEVFVNERDIYLTKSLQIAAHPLPNPMSVTGYTPRTVVGVVGIGHVPGIVRLWGKVKDEDIPPIMIIPPPSISDRLVKVTCKITFLGLVGVAVYWALPESVKTTISESFRSSVKASLQLVFLHK